MREPSRRLRVATWPAPSEFSRSPYLEYFHGAMGARGVVALAGVVPTAQWLAEQRSAVDAIHIHWPDGLWRAGKRSTLTRIPAAVRLHRFWRDAGARGIKIIWTVHNLERHEGSNWLDRVCYRTLAGQCDALICHSQSAAVEVRQRYRPPGEVVVMAMGSFPNLYPPPRPRLEVLERLGLNPELPVVCCLGNLRPYKGLMVACEAAVRLKGVVQLVVGGRPYGNWVDVSTIRRLLEGEQVGVLIDRVLTDQEFSDITAASEAVVLPYHNITGSAALLTAWTLGRGVVASDLAYFREVSAGEPDAAAFFREGDPADLSNAIMGFLRVPFARRQAAAERLAARYAWERCIEPVVDLFDRWKC